MGDRGTGVTLLLRTVSISGTMSSLSSSGKGPSGVSSSGTGPKVAGSSCVAICGPRWNCRGGDVLCLCLGGEGGWRNVCGKFSGVSSTAIGRQAGCTLSLGIGARALCVEDTELLELRLNLVARDGDCGGRLDKVPMGRRPSSERFDQFVCVEGLLADVAFESALLLIDLVSVLCLFAFSGRPSHLLLTFGTCSGSFRVDTVAAAFALLPFCCAFFRSASANCSRASAEGSFMVRKPSIPLFFFFPIPFGSVPVKAWSFNMVRLVRLLDPDPDWSLGLRPPPGDGARSDDDSDRACVPFSALPSVTVVDAVGGRAGASPLSTVLLRTASFGIRTV